MKTTERPTVMALQLNHAALEVAKDRVDLRGLEPRLRVQMTTGYWLELNARQLRALAYYMERVAR